MRLTEQDRICIPVPLYHCFRHGDGQPRLRHARRHHGLSRRRL
jgi:hypothetical protein